MQGDGRGLPSTETAFNPDFRWRYPTVAGADTQDRRAVVDGPSSIIERQGESGATLEPPAREGPVSSQSREAGNRPHRPLSQPPPSQPPPRTPPGRQPPRSGRRRADPVERPRGGKVRSIVLILLLDVVPVQPRRRPTPLVGVSTVLAPPEPP